MDLGLLSGAVNQEGNTLLGVVGAIARYAVGRKPPPVFETVDCTLCVGTEGSGLFYGCFTVGLICFAFGLGLGLCLGPCCDLLYLARRAWSRLVARLTASLIPHEIEQRPPPYRRPRTLPPPSGPW